MFSSNGLELLIDLLHFSLRSPPIVFELVATLSSTHPAPPGAARPLSGDRLGPRGMSVSSSLANLVFQDTGVGDQSLGDINPQQGLTAAPRTWLLVRPRPRNGSSRRRRRRAVNLEWEEVLDELAPVLGMPPVGQTVPHHAKSSAVCPRARSRIDGPRKRASPPEAYRKGERDTRPFALADTVVDRPLRNSPYARRPALSNGGEGRAARAGSRRAASSCRRRSRPRTERSRRTRLASAGDGVRSKLWSPRKRQKSRSVTCSRIILIDPTYLVGRSPGRPETAPVTSSGRPRGPSTFCDARPVP